MYSRAQFDLAFYLEYLAKWPEYCLVAEGPGRQVMGYIVGKVEGQGEHWHGHVTAVTVASDFRCAETRTGPSREGEQTIPWTRCCDHRMPCATAENYASSSLSCTSSCRCLPHCTTQQLSMRCV